MNQLPPSPTVSHQDRFQFFRKFAEIFASQGAPQVGNFPLVSMTPAPVSIVLLISVANLPPVSTHQWQFAIGINDTGGKFATGVNETGGK